MNKNSNLFRDRTISIGLDVHLKSYKVSYLVDGQFYKTCTHGANSSEVINYVKTNFPGGKYQSAYEAGFAGYQLHYNLQAAGIENLVVHPSDVPVTQKNKEQKTDARDSKQIAQCLYGGLLTCINIPNLKQQSDRSLVRHRDKIVSHLTRIRNQIKMSLYYQGIEIPEQFSESGWSKVFISWLSGLNFREQSGTTKMEIHLSELSHYRNLLLRVNRALRQLSRSTYYKEDYDILVSTPGIGLIGGMRFLTEIGDVERFNSSEKLCSYMGLIPNSRSSGERDRKSRITYRANKRMRSQLIEAAWVAIRNDPSMMAYYAKKTRGNKKNSNRAIVSTARKLLCRIYYILNARVKYIKNKA